MAKRRNWSLVGIPDHQGVNHVRGRLGAARGPMAFRRAFVRLKGPGQIHESLDDFGDSKGTLRIDVNHRDAAHKVAEAHAATGLSVIVGGGQDHAFTHLQGLAAAEGSKVRLGCINIDAHLDVRKPEPLITSGSPFYLAIESGLLDPSRFVEFGIQSHSNSPELWDYVEARKIRVVTYPELRHGKAVPAFRAALKQLESRCDLIAISLDLDSIASAFAPGVSAPQAEGFTASEVIEMMEIAGNSAKTRSLGVFELCPEHDSDGRTALLAATAVWHFVAAALGRSRSATE